MTSERKIAANRVNAQKSTGPKTPRGKALSRLNALKFGAFSGQPLIRGENAGEHNKLLQRLRAELAPKGVMDDLIVDQIFGDMWRLKRVEYAERAYFEKTRMSLLSEILDSLSDRELDLIIPSIANKDVAEEARATRTRRENESKPPFCCTTDVLDSLPDEMDARQEQAVKSGLKARIDEADDLGSIFLEGIATEQDERSYDRLDRLRRSLVRDILQKNQTLAIQQRDRRTIDSTSIKSLP